MANAEERAKLQELSAAGSLASMNAELSAAENPNFDTLFKTTALQKRLERDKLQNSLCTRLLTLLRHGKVLAYGYAQPRHVTDTPRAIAESFWQQQLALPSGASATHAGLTFKDIRIVLRPAETITPPSVGRPSP